MRCRAPTPSSSTRRSGSTPRPYASEISSIRLRAARWSSQPKRAGSAPSTTFSSTVRLSASMKCWCTMPIPAAIASPGVEKLTSRPPTEMVPSSGRCIPYRIFISVDLPAPFSPTSACTVPARTAKCTSLLATTPGKRLVMPRSSTAVAPVPGPVSSVAGAATPTPLSRDEPGGTLPRHPRARCPGAIRQETVVGTVIVPSTICFFRSSSWVLMSSILPPEVA